MNNIRNKIRVKAILGTDLAFKYFWKEVLLCCNSYWSSNSISCIIPQGLANVPLSHCAPAPVKFQGMFVLLKDCFLKDSFWQKLTDGLMLHTHIYFLFYCSFALYTVAPIGM